MPYFTHQFEAEITRHELGKYVYTVVFLPREIAAQLPFHTSARLRVEADVSGLPVKGAWQPSGPQAGHRWYLMLPKKPLKDAELAIGSRVEVSFKLVPQSEVDIPPELDELLANNSAVKQVWAAWSPGKQRALAIMVQSAKRPETRSARLQQVQHILLGEAPVPWVMGGRKSRKK
jgi:hypothetical protein